MDVPIVVANLIGFLVTSYLCRLSFQVALAAWGSSRAKEPSTLLMQSPNMPRAKTFMRWSSPVMCFLTGVAAIQAAVGMILAVA